MTPSPPATFSDKAVLPIGHPTVEACIHAVQKSFQKLRRQTVASRKITLENYADHDHALARLFNQIAINLNDKKETPTCQHSPTTRQTTPEQTTSKS